MKQLLVLALCVSAWAQNPNTAAFPSAVATDTTLPIATPQPATVRTLNGAISSGATSFVLSSAGSDLKVPSYWTIRDTPTSTNGETFLCTVLTVNTLSGCTGHQDGTTAAAHANGSYVYSFLGATMYNQITAEIKAIETALAGLRLGSSVGGGTAQAQTASPLPPLQSLGVGAMVRWYPSAANTAAAPTLAVSGLTAKPITKLGTTALVANDLTTTAFAEAIYDGTQWELQNPQTNSGGGGAVSSVYGLTGAVNPKADQQDAVTFAADAGSTDTYVATLSPAITAYVTGTHYRFKANTANTGAASINFNSLGAKTIVKAAGGITTALVDNDIRAGQWIDVVYDGTNMQMQSTLGNIPSTGSATITLTTVSFSATPTFTRGTSIQQWQLTLTGNVTSSTTSGLASADVLVFNICQDATGGRTFSWPTGFSQAATISPTASICTKQVFYWDGSAAIAITGGITSDTTFLISGTVTTAPATPPASSATVYVDSTSKNLAVKDDAGVVKHGAQTFTCTNQFPDRMSDPGVFTCRSVATTDLASVQGNGTKVQLSTGTTTANDCVKFDANGNTVDAGAACGSGGGGGGVSAKTTNYTTVSGDAGTIITFSGTTLTASLLATPSATYAVGIKNLNASALTVSRNGLTINGGTSNITLQQYQDTTCFSDGTNYQCSVPYTAGSNVTLTPSVNGIAISTASGGDFSSNTSTSVDSEFVLFSSTAGKTGKRATGTGIARSASGVYSAAELSGDVSTSGSNAVTIGAAKVAPSMMKASTYDAQTDGATITWAIGSVLNANASVTLGGNRTLNITGPVIGGSYVLKITQDGTGSRTLALGTGCTWKVVNGGAGAITPTTTAGAIDLLIFTYDGTNCFATLSKGYN